VSARWAAILQIISGLLLSVFLVLLAFCIWTLDRGFDITDESYSLLLAIYPKAFEIFVSAAHWITSSLWAVTGGLYEFRAIGLGILLLGSLFLALGVMRASALCDLSITPGHGSRLAIISTTFVAALHWVTYGASVFFTPSYNLLATAASYSAIGFTLLACGREAAWRDSALRLLAGGSLGIIFLSKFPAGIYVSVLTLFIIASCALSMRERLAGATLTFLGMGTAVLLVMSLQMTPAIAWENFRLGLKFYGIGAQEPIVVRLMRYVEELFSHWTFTVTEFALPLLCFIFYARFKYRLFLVLGIALLVTILTTQGYLLGGYPRISSQVTSLVVLMMLIALATISVWTRSAKSAVLSGSLLVLPYCISFGTSNSLPPQILVSLASWGSLFALLSYQLDVVEKVRIVPLLLCVIFTVVAAAQILTSGFFASYHMARSLSEQSEPVRVGAIGVVRVDQQIHEFVTSLADSARRCSIAPGRPFLGFYNIPGVALVIQGVPILTPWLVAPEQAQSWLKAAPTDTLRSAIVGLQLRPDGTAPQVADILPTFPEHYRLCGTATYPYEEQRIQLWAPDQ
jgi:hypothetical protein